jgi:hypothetical protein
MSLQSACDKIKEIAESGVVLLDNSIMTVVKSKSGSYVFDKVTNTIKLGGQFSE